MTGAGIPLGSWGRILLCEADEPACYHVVPFHDLRNHRVYLNEECWCHPMVDEDEDIPIHVHNSMDRREHTIEKGIVQ